MIEEIIHPTRGEKGFFITDNQYKVIKAVMNDYVSSTQVGVDLLE